MRTAFASLRRAECGATATEFALILPALLVLMLGLGDLSFQGYLQSALTGAVQKAGRDSAIQGNATQTDMIDQRVKTVINAISSSATFASSRTNFDNYAAIGPEPFTDTNNNGVRDPKECFSDINGNGIWDADPGTSGQGGANDVTLYTMQVTYRRLFPIANYIGWGATKTISASTILKNQPYATQTTTTVQTLCT